ncbi:MAG: ABC transporter ATP-binding protein [Erysipelotrichaceae bacterium]|nr:ABC transporter ATP-binding protein [Erysipelotrichaceae bacterium]
MPRNMKTQEKPADFSKSFGHLLADMRKYLPALLLSLVLAAICNIISVLSPDYLSKIVNAITDGISTTVNMDTITSLAIILVCMYFASSLFGYIQTFLFATISNKYANELRSRIASKINRLPLKYFDNHEMGDILSRITNDVDTMAQHLNGSFGELVSSVTLFIGALTMMFLTNWVMALTAIGSSVIGFVFMFAILGKSQKYFNERQKQLGKLNGHIEEMYSGQMIVRAYNGEKSAVNTFDELNEGLYSCNMKSRFLSGLMQPFMSFVGNFGYVAVCVIGALLVLNGSIKFGVIVAFVVYVRQFTNPLSQIASAMQNMQSVVAASERVFGFLNEPEMSDETGLVHKPEHIEGRISFEHVQFGYDETRTIIKDFCCDARPGQKIAIVGPTGAGKTTLVNLLMKFYEINSGSICIDGIPTTQLSREAIHSLFTMVLQDTWLFDGTVKENLTFSKKNVTDEEIWKVLKTVGIDHFVRSLPGGLDARIDDSDSVSQGQKQLLTIARGMIEGSPFLILDEATSNVDTRTEELVQKAMDELMRGKTSFIIAHRLSTIRNADLILVMNEGNVIEQGTHESLMELNGFYAELYNSQFSKNG